MRVESKCHLVASIEASWTQLLESLENTRSQIYEKRIQLKNSARKESIKDVIAHLLGWHKLFLGWYKTGKNGTPEMPAKGWKWNQTPQLNQQIFDHWRDVSFRSIKRRLTRSHNQIMAITNEIPEDELMTPGSFVWTGKLSIAKYIASATTSHYKWALTKIKKVSVAIDAR